MLITLYSMAALAALAIIPLVMPFIAPFLPRDLSGPDGWFIDTERGDGIFDWRRHPERRD